MFASAFNWFGCGATQVQSDEVLLEYVLAKPASFCLVRTRDRARLVRLPSSAEIEPLIDAELKALKTQEKPSTQPAHNLYRVLLGQILSAISRKPPGRRFVIDYLRLTSQEQSLHCISSLPHGSRLNQAHPQTANVLLACR